MKDKHDNELSERAVKALEAQAASLKVIATNTSDIELDLNLIARSLQQIANAVTPARMKRLFLFFGEQTKST